TTRGLSEWWFRGGMDDDCSPGGFIMKIRTVMNYLTIKSCDIVRRGTLHDHRDHLSARVAQEFHRHAGRDKVLCKCERILPRIAQGSPGALGGQAYRETPAGIAR